MDIFGVMGGVGYGVGCGIGKGTPQNTRAAKNLGVKYTGHFTKISQVTPQKLDTPPARGHFFVFGDTQNFAKVGGILSYVSYNIDCATLGG